MNELHLYILTFIDLKMNISDIRVGDNVIVTMLNRVIHVTSCHYRNKTWKSNCVRVSVPCTSAESGSTCQAHQGRLERELGGGGSYFSSITLGSLDLLPLPVTCFCRFICRILIHSKTGDLATLSAVSLLALTPTPSK